MERKPKHILYLVADELRADCIAPYGNTQVHTPALDSLAADGRIYENAFCTFPVCTPSRYSMMTGLYAHQHRCLDNRTGIPADLPTLPQLLHDNGYRTGAVGKLHCNPPRQELGFEWALLAEQCGEGRYEDDYHRFLQERGLVDTVDLMDQCEEWRNKAPREYWDSFGNLPPQIPEGSDSTSWIGENALRKVEQWGEESQFLMVSFIKPHHPFDAPEAWRKQYRAEEMILLPGWMEHVPKRDYERDHGYFDNALLTRDVLKQILASYYASITQIDYWIGRLIDALKEKELYEDTMILFTADHGDYMGFHHMLLKCNRMYDPLMRIPLLVKEAGSGSGNGHRQKELYSHPDLFSDLLHSCGIPLPEGTPKRTTNKAGRKYVFAQQQVEGKPEYMVRSQTHKLLLSERETLLFDLREDPLEQENRYGQEAYRPIWEDLQNALAKQMLFDAPPAPCLDKTTVYTMQDLAAIHERRMYFAQKMADYMKTQDSIKDTKRG